VYSQDKKERGIALVTHDFRCLHIIRQAGRKGSTCANITQLSDATGLGWCEEKKKEMKKQ